jgi:hypothetical protein
MAFLILMLIHWIADFVLQADWMAKNKSKYMIILITHCFIYAVCFSMALPAKIVFILFLTHFVIDFFSSKLNSYLYNRSRHYFFVSIGFDQLLHLTVLYCIFKYISIIN